MAPDFDPEDLEGIDLVVDADTRKTYTPSRRQKIRSFTVACLILNRTIGSGIFVTPAKILRATNSVGVSILVWAIGGFLSLCGLMVWLEFSRSTPRRKVASGEVQCVPRSGGEKNYLEHVLRKPKFLAVCMYGIPFILLGNLSGNAIALGRYVMLAAGYSDQDGNLTASHGSIIGIAVATLTACVLVHMASRRGGIILNNCFAVFKVVIFLVILILGFAIRGGANFSKAQPPPPKIGNQNFETKTSFANAADSVSSFTTSFIFVMYTYSGFEQPFYVLSEVHKPKQNFAKACIFTMLFTITMFVLLNVAYLCVVPFDVIKANPDMDIATLFFYYVFGSNTAKRVMQGAIALSIFGNVVVMTFTASRVKQEIAKEGILPGSLFFATGRTTPVAWLKARFARNRENPCAGEDGGEVQRGPKEQSPMAALGLHWASSVLLIAVTSGLSSGTAYDFLVQLYSYVITVFVGFWVATGLLWCKFVRKDWVGEIRIWGGPTAAIIYWIAALFFLITAFLKPSATLKSGYPWYLVPTIGISTICWGVIWYGGLRLVMRWRGHKLKVTRKPYISQDEENGEWVMKYEIIRHVWKPNLSGMDSDSSDEDDDLKP